MLLGDYLHLATTSIRFSRMRSFLTALGIAVGIAAVVLLTALGSGAQQYILQQFTQFGAHIIAINPGKSSTLGVSGAMISNVRPLSLDDADSLRRIPGVQTAVPVVQGNSPVEADKRTRWTTVLGLNHETPQTWQLQVASGVFLPVESARQARNLAVIGAKIRSELFPDQNPLGQHIRIGQERFRVIGVMESKGQILGFDMDDAVYIPVARAMALFNREGLMEIDVLYQAGADEAGIIRQIRDLLIQRHGTEDITITSQTDMLKTLGSILDILKAVVAGIGSISLLVGGVGILTIMSIAVNERTGEIGLLRALGASRRQVTRLFLLEAAALAGLGGIAGMLAGIGIALLLHVAIPAMPVQIDWLYVFLAEIIAITTGLLAGFAPARRASALPPVEALRNE
ncbi:MAG TPA: ABC transporter permease [Candidatus Thiothrix moscowensis]|uniref:ABC transporter permease n=1 Tax=unclassified Thiothrix TaxID=2636184 RepID=UPI0025CC934E|nr:MULTISPECIES: ABC transporter permease [unclassified Thiothrix]HRJ54275.1 ABC transporter permease [Candidatus Thiothrix moscowensis]HRJ94537.1 ABC transporter permease [Candidatus Thiothrix moscowensis]